MKMLLLQLVVKRQNKLMLINLMLQLITTILFSQQPVLLNHLFIIK